MIYPFSDSFQEDVGGPLVCKSDQSWFQAGIIMGPSQRNFARAQDILTLSKPAMFSAFLRNTVGDLPTPAADENTILVNNNNVAANASPDSLSLSFLLALIPAMLSLAVFAE